MTCKVCGEKIERWHAIIPYSDCTARHKRCGLKNIKLDVKYLKTKKILYNAPKQPMTQNYSQNPIKRSQ